MDAWPAESLEMLEKPALYRRHFMDLRLWQPFVAQACRQHGLDCQSVRPGLPGSFPTFIVDEQVVVKFFGELFDGRVSYQVEAGMAGLLKDDPGIPSPSVLGSGSLPTPTGRQWDYLIFPFILGDSLGEVRAQVSLEDKLVLAGALGKAVRRLHNLQLPTQAVPFLPPARSDYVHFLEQQGANCLWSHRTWRSLPPHLLSQMDAFRLPTEAWLEGLALPHLIHADLTGDHILGRLEGDHWRLLGIIDYGDARLGNLFYELIAVHLDLFDCDKRLLVAFLDGYGLDGWAQPDFVRKAMTGALLHQFDAVGPVLRRHPHLRKVQTLEELAARLWELNAPGIEA